MSLPARPIAADLTADGIAAALAHLDEHVDRSGGPDACWPYRGGSRVGGYAVFHVRKADGKRRLIKAHRLVYEVETGTCPPTVDHRCHDGHECRDVATCPHRACCNPRHLRGETTGDNAARSKTGVYREMCQAGLHRMTDDNVYVNSRTGGRQCRACMAARARERRREARSARVAAAVTGVRVPRPQGMSGAETVLWALGDLLRRAESDPEIADACWPWPQKPDVSGYVYVRLGKKMVLAHRLVHEVLIGPIPEGHHVDHRCHDPKACSGGMTCPHRACANPRHLRAVAPAVNNGHGRTVDQRRERCPAGHVYDKRNTRIATDGSKVCRKCAAQAAARVNKKVRGAQPDRRFRKGGICRNGHDTAETGVEPDGKCSQCRHDRNAVKRASAKREGETVAV